MPNSDLKYYAVGVVSCDSQIKYQLLQTISCGHKIVYNELHIFFPLGPASAALRTATNRGIIFVSNCFVNISGPNYMKKKYIYVQNIVIEEYKNPERKNITITKIHSEIGGLVADHYPRHARRVKNLI